MCVSISSRTAAYRVGACGARSHNGVASMKTLHVERLTRAAFAPFGDVIELDGARHFPINGGTTERYHDLANVDVTEHGGRPLINLFRAQPRALPIQILMMEQHPLPNPPFIPLPARHYLSVVPPPADV